MFACCCDQNRPSRLRRCGRLLTIWLLTGFLLQTVTAHSPFESNARITIFAGHIEAAVTSGTGLAGELLKDTGIDPTKPSGFAGVKVTPEISQRIIGLEAAGQVIPADSVKLQGDGLEAMLVVTFPRPPAGSIKLSANYASHVPAGTVSALVVVDEPGRMIGSHLVTSGNNVMEFQLAANVPTTVAAADKSETQNPESKTDQSLLTSAATNHEVAPPAQTPSFLEYLKLGIHHIVTGYDHLLFLCGLLVGCKRIGPMLAIITCFTLAHSITLALAAMDVVAISPRIVEPIIAASIIFVGIENFRRGDNVKARCWLALGFGLIHGFGFAGALRETGLGNSGGSLVSALFSFNLGVELGQLVIAAIFLGTLWQLRRFKPVEQYATPVISGLVIALGGWWLVERTLLP
jgi:hydrogenase/urease accessory protein HupE